MQKILVNVMFGLLIVPIVAAFALPGKVLAKVKDRDKGSIVEYGKNCHDCYLKPKAK